MINGHKKNILTTKERNEKEAVDNLLKWLSTTSMKKISAKAYSIKKSKTSILDALVRQSRRTVSMDRIFEGVEELAHNTIDSSVYNDSDKTPDDKAGLEAYMMVHSDSKFLDNDHKHLDEK